MADIIRVKGLAELQKMLGTIAPRIQKNIMRGALRAGMQVIRKEAQSNIHSVSGLLASGLKVSTRVTGGRVISKLKATGKHAPIAHLVEYGTAAHSIDAKIKRGLSFGGGVVRKSVNHPGARPAPFMRPALDSQHRAAVVAVGSYVKQRLTKQGLDASHVIVEGDE